METDDVSDPETLFLKERRENFSVLPFAMGLLPDDFIKERVRKKNIQDIRNPKFAKNIYYIVALYEIMDVPRDGNCLFWSITLAYLITCYGALPSHENFINILQKLIGKKIVGQHDVVNFFELKIKDFLKTLDDALIFNKFTLTIVECLRKRMIKLMRRNRGFFSKFIFSDFDEYLKTMSVSGMWGGQVEIVALCNLLDCNISVYDKTYHRIILHRPESIKKVSSAEDLSTLYLTFENGNHYSFIFLETNFQRERRENFLSLPFAAFEDSFNGFFLNDIEYKFKVKSSISILLEKMRESMGDSTLFRYIKLCQFVCFLSQVTLLISKSDLSHFYFSIYQFIFFLFRFDLSEPLAYLGEIAFSLFKEDKFLNYDKPMLIDAGVGACFNLENYFSMKIPFFTKKEAKNDAINQEVSQPGIKISR